MKILHVTAPAAFGGLEQVVSMLTRGLSERGHDVSVIAVVAHGQPVHPFTTSLRDAGIGVSEISLRPKDYAGERKAVRAILTGLQPDVVHTHGYRADVLDSPVARKQLIPVVTTVHGFTGGGVKNRFYEYLQIRSFRKMQRVIAVSNSIRDRLVASGVAAQRVRVLRNSYRNTVPLVERAEARERLGLEPSGFHVGWVGRLSREKGPDVMLRAAQLAAADGCVFSFVGDGPMAPELRARTTHAGFNKSVKFHGAVAGSAAFMKAFDLVVISSRTEGTPMVLLEAILAGVPVIATSVGGIPDVVSPAEALMVDSEDAEGIARAIRRLREEPATASALAARARVRVNAELSPDSWIDSHVELYCDLIRGNKHQA